jgi:hypothetical protein
VSLAWSRLMLRWSRRRWPRVPLWSRRTVLNVAGSVLSLLVAFGALLFALLADKGHHQIASSGTPLPTDSSSTSESTIYIPPLPTNFNSDFPGLGSLTGSASPTGTSTDTSTATGTPGGSGSGSSSATPLTIDSARQAVVAYIDAVNARNRIQAAALICQSLQPAWLQNVDSSNSDFNFTITSARFVASSPLGGGSLFLRYTLEFNDNTTNAVDFTVIEESGPKICGEQRA